MAIPLWVGRFIGCPYVEEGSSYDGMDCWGLVERVHADVVGVPLPPYPGTRKWAGTGRDIAQAVADYSKHFLSVLPGQEREFDIALIMRAGRPTHVAVVTTPGWMLHSDEGSNVTHERYRPSLLWSKRIVGFYRFES